MRVRRETLFGGLFLFGLLVLLIVADQTVLAGRGALEGEFSLIVEMLFNPAGVVVDEGPDWTVLVWLAVELFWSCITWLALRWAGTGVWARVGLVLLLWLPPAQWITFGVVCWLLNKTETVRGGKDGEKTKVAAHGRVRQSDHD